jgi:hypothetical protein
MQIRHATEQPAGGFLSFLTLRYSRMHANDASLLTPGPIVSLPPSVWIKHPPVGRIQIARAYPEANIHVREFPGASIG